VNEILSSVLNIERLRQAFQSISYL